MSSLSKSVIKYATENGAKFLTKPQKREVDTAFDDLPLAIAQFLYQFEWPKGVTFSIEHPEAHDEWVWMLDWAYTPLELLTEDHADYYKSNFQMCAIYDGGNYILAFDINDKEGDPWVYLFDSEEEDPNPEKRRLSDLLGRMKRE